MKTFMLILFLPAFAAAQPSDTIVFRQQLDSVTVRSGPRLVKQLPGGIVVNPQASVLTKGSNALQALERMPGVARDYRNGGLSLNGKTGVRILVDGRTINLPDDQLTTFLEGLNAENIDRVELLTSPPAGMDAEGGGGVINIIRKKNRRDGMNGVLTLSAGYGYREKAGARLQLARKNKNLNMYGNYAFGYNHTYSDMFIPSEQGMPIFGGKLHVLVYDTSRTKQLSHDATAGIDLSLDSHTTIGSSITINNSTGNSISHPRQDFFIEPDSLLFYKGLIGSTTKWNNIMQNVYFERTKERRTISASADYLLFSNHFPSEVSTYYTDRHGNAVQPEGNSFLANQHGEGRTRIDVGVIKIDYTMPVGKGKLETGVKGTWTKSNSRSGIVERVETWNKVIMNEGTGAAYASLNQPINANTDITAGFRYEYNSSVMNNPDTKERLITRRGGNVFPSVSFTHRIKEERAMSLSWTKRITRPAYTDLASYVRYNDPAAIFTGNPLLKPSITNNVEIRYSVHDWSFALMMSRDKNMLVRYQISESADRTILLVSPQNLAWQNNILLQAVAPLKIAEWWNISTTLTGGWRQFRAVHTVRPVTKSYLFWSFNGMQTFRLPKKFSAELSGWYNTSAFNGPIKTGAVGVVNVGVKKELNKDKGSFQLAVSDVLSTMKFTSRYGAITNEAFNIKNKVEFYTESAKFPVFRLTYSRSFGGVAQKIRSNNGSAEEKSRLSY